MANPMGLMGANNPIFQVSQQRAQDASQNKNAAVQGIINQAMQQKQNEITAKLKVNAALMESKDPYYFQKGYEGMAGMMNIPIDNDIMAHMEDIRNSWSELRKLEGKVDPQTFKGLVTETLTRYPGSAPEGVTERAQQASETNWLSQATQIPGLHKQGLLTPEQAAQGTQTALQGAGSKGQEVLAASLKATEKPEKDFTQTATLVSPKDNKPHVYKYNPETDRYDIDQGVAPSSAYQEGIQGRSNEDKYLRVVSLADNDDTVKQFKRTQQVTPYIEDAVKTFKKTGNAGILQDALIYSHNKILDADSVVMVSEYLRARGMQSLIDKAQGNIYKLFDGSAGLSLDQQKTMLEAVQNALKRKENAYDQRMKSFRKMASRYVTDKEELKNTFPLSNEIFGEERNISTEQTGPQIGEIQHGYKFKGGDPSSPDNWEQVR